MQASWLSFKPTHLFVFPYAYAAALILHWFGSLKIPIIPCGFVALLFHSPIRFFLYTKTHVFQCFQCIFHPNWFGTRLIYLLRVMWDSPGRGSRPQFHVLPISAHGTKAAMALRCRGLRGLQKKTNLCCGKSKPLEVHSFPESVELPCLQKCKTKLPECRYFLRRISRTVHHLVEI